MDEERIENALRAGPPDEPRHRQGALARALDERESPTEATYRVALRPGQWPAFAGVLVAIALIGVISAVLWRTDVGPGPSPSPSPTSPIEQPTASGSLGGAPAMLVDRWVGPVRSIDDLPSAATRAALDIQGVGFRYDAGPGQPQDIFASSLSALPDQQLRLTSISATGGCKPFDEGVYAWSVSPGGTTLTLAALEDGCEARAATIAGAWTHTACRLASNDCLGVIEAGLYSSTDLDVDGTGRSGQVRYTVPNGWANTIDHPTSYFIRPAADYLADASFDGNDSVSGVYLQAGSVPIEQPPDCSPVPAAGIAVTASAMADYFLALPGLDATNAEPLVIDGLPTRVVDMILESGYETTCPFSNGQAFRSLITWADLGPDRGLWGVSATEQVRMYLVDVAPDRVLTIWIDAEPAEFTELLPEAVSIVESLEITR